MAQLPARQVKTGTPVSISSTNTKGSADSLALSDHTHAHANQGGGTLHTEASGTSAGFMSIDNFNKLGGVEAGAQVVSATRVLTALAAAGSAVSVNGQRIANVATPSSGTDAATKNYVDSATNSGALTFLTPLSKNAQGQVSIPIVTLSAPGYLTAEQYSWLEYYQGYGLNTVELYVRLVSTGPTTLSGSGQVIDGKAVVAGDLVLVANGTSASNGVYTVGTGAWARNDGVWTTPSYSSSITTYTKNLQTGRSYFVYDGTSYVGTIWSLANAPGVGAMQGGTTPLTYVQVGGPSTTVTATSPLTKTGNALSLPKASSTQDGYLSAADWTAFKGTNRACLVATTANVTLVGGAPSTVDGYAVTTTDRIMVKSQTNSAENGIYYPTSVGAGSNGTWARVADLNASEKFFNNTVVFVQYGTASGAAFFAMAVAATFVLGTDAVGFNRVSPTVSTPLAIASNGSISIPVATASASGYLTFGDWSTFYAGALMAPSGRVAVHAATTGNVANLATGAPSVVDGVALSVGSRILLKDQTTQTQNGLYYVAVLGTGSTGSWSRTTDASSSYSGMLQAYSFTLVAGGTVNGGTIWAITTPNSTATTVVLGTTAIAYSQVPIVDPASVASVSAPLVKTARALSLPAATTSTDGYLTQANWNAFNTGSSLAGTAIQSGASAGGSIGGTYPSALTVTKLNETSGPTALTIGAIADGQFLKRVGSTLVSAASGDVTGPSSNASTLNIAVFNGTGGKTLADGGATIASLVPGTRTLTTTAPLTIASVSGSAIDLSTSRTLAMPAAASGVDGYMTAAQASAVAAAVPNTRTFTATAPLTIAGGTSANLSVDRTIAISTTPSFASVTSSLFLAGTMYDWGATNAVSHNVTTQANDFAVGPITGALTVTLAGGVAGRQGTFIVRQNASTAYGMTVTPTGFSLVKDSSLANYNPSTTLSSFTIYSYYFVVCGGSSICVLGRLPLA